MTRTTDSFTRVMRVEPMLGRWFSADEASPRGRPVAVLSHGLWQRRYGGDPAVIGRTLELEGVTHEVIGVMPVNFALTRLETDVWIPLQLGPENVRAAGFNFSGIGRLTEGTTVADARAETNRLIAQLPEDFPDDASTRWVLDEARLESNISPLKDEVVRRTTPLPQFAHGRSPLFFIFKTPMATCVQRLSSFSGRAPQGDMRRSPVDSDRTCRS